MKIVNHFTKISRLLLRNAHSARSAVTEVLSEVVSDRMNVGPDVLDAHYDRRSSEQERLKNGEATSKSRSYHFWRTLSFTSRWRWFIKNSGAWFLSPHLWYTHVGIPSAMCIPYVFLTSSAISLLETPRISGIFPSSDALGTTLFRAQ